MPLAGVLDGVDEGDHILELGGLLGRRGPRGGGGDVAGAADGLLQGGAVEAGVDAVPGEGPGALAAEALLVPLDLAEDRLHVGGELGEGQVAPLQGLQPLAHGAELGEAVAHRPDEGAHRQQEQQQDPGPDGAEHQRPGIQASVRPNTSTRRPSATRSVT